MFPNNFTQQLVDALLHVLITIGRVLLLPLNLWVKSTSTLVGQKQRDFFDMNTIDTPWPYLTWAKRWIIDFSFDAAVLLIYPIGIIVSIWGFIEFFKLGFGAAMEEFVISLIVFYFMPLVIACVRDCVVFSLLPLNKIIDWFKKPAQWLEIKENK